MVAPYVAELQQVLTADRLDRYRPAGGDDLAMAVTYLWNVELCQALYHSMGALEMVTRNSIHAVLTTHHGRSDWYHVPGFLKWRQPDKVADVIEDIRGAGKRVIPGRVVAGLDFGFWTTLLSRGYGPLWSRNNQALIKQAFPLAPVGMQYRGRVFDHINPTRLLRNRVFHDESIWDDPDLVQKQANIIDAIGWISPTLQASVNHFDRFPHVLQNGRAEVEQQVKVHLGIV